MTGKTAEYPTFHVGLLLRDTRYRAMTIQFVVLVGLVLALMWLANNTVQNLAAKGRDLDFSFLFQSAGYDINFSLIDYTSRSSHLRAAVVGLLNTLLVASIGCVLAAVLGVMIGIMRLSSNWLVSRLASVYVEAFRNIPVLLWILVVNTLLTETMPTPADYRLSEAMKAAGESPKASMLLDGSIAVTTRGLNLPVPVFSRGLAPVDLGLVVLDGNLLALIAALVLGWWLQRSLRRHALKQQAVSGVMPKVGGLRGLAVIAPLGGVLWLLGTGLDFPVLGKFDFSGGMVIPHSFTSLTLGLALYTAAFIAEIVRGGIVAIPRGQVEAAAALGLPAGHTMRLVILPQALRIIIPPMISQFLSLTKNTSLAIAVTFIDLRGTLGGITLNQTGRELECMLLMMIVYLSISLAISAVINVYNRGTQLKER